MGSSERIENLLADFELEKACFIIFLALFLEWLDRCFGGRSESSWPGELHLYIYKVMFRVD